MGAAYPLGSTIAPWQSPLQALYEPTQILHEEQPTSSPIDNYHSLGLLLFFAFVLTAMNVTSMNSPTQPHSTLFMTFTVVEALATAAGVSSFIRFVLAEKNQRMVLVASIASIVCGSVASFYAAH